MQREQQEAGRCEKRCCARKELARKRRGSGPARMTRAMTCTTVGKAAAQGNERDARARQDGREATIMAADGWLLRTLRHRETGEVEHRLEGEGLSWDDFCTARMQVGWEVKRLRHSCAKPHEDEVWRRLSSVPWSCLAIHPSPRRVCGSGRARVDQDEARMMRRRDGSLLMLAPPRPPTSRGVHEVLRHLFSR